MYSPSSSIDSGRVAVESAAPERVEVLRTLLDERHSCRAFLDTPVPGEVIDTVLAMAQRSPSWCNTQPWEVTILTGSALEAVRTDFVEHASTHATESDIAFPERYRGRYLDRRRESAWQLYDSLGIAKGDRAASAAQTLENFRFFGAPAVAVVTTEADLGTYGAVDCGVYIAHFLITAQALGLATITQAALASHSPFLRERLRLPTNREVVAGISFGYEDATHPANNFRTARADAATVATLLS